MTLRAGSFDDTRPRWQGIIRNDGAPWYRCWHRGHKSPKEARECARTALREIQARQQVPGGEEWLPENWTIYVWERP